LRDFGSEGYAGVILRGENGRPIGIIAMMSRRPLTSTTTVESILKLVAVRAEGELERDFVIEALRQSEGQLAKLNSELEANVERRTADLRVINEELESFSYSVAHDLRAPLRAIGGFSAMVLGKNEGALDSVSVSHLQRIKTNAERMAELIDDLLNLTRVSRQQLHRIDFDLSVVAQSVADAMAEAAPRRTVEVRVQPGMRVNADPGLIRVVLENLIGNAWKFTAAVTPALIEVGCAVRDGRNEYFVRDNGAGFDMNYAGKLFAPFQRLHGREEFEGTGIGLSIVRRVVMKHGGAVRAEAQVNAGAVFYFTLG
jgi:signal transduction histidine kinase